MILQKTTVDSRKRVYLFKSRESLKADLSKCSGRSCLEATINHRMFYVQQESKSRPPSLRNVPISLSLPSLLGTDLYSHYLQRILQPMRQRLSLQIHKLHIYSVSKNDGNEHHHRYPMCNVCSLFRTQKSNIRFSYFRLQISKPLRGFFSS